MIAKIRQWVANIKEFYGSIYSFISFYLLSFISIVIVLGGTVSFFYIRFWIEKVPINIPSQNYPYLSFCIYLLLLIISIGAIIIPSIIKVYRKYTFFKKKQPSKFILLGTKMVKLFASIIKILSFPFITFYFLIINNIPYLYDIVIKLWSKFLLPYSKSTHIFDIFFSIIPYLIIYCALFIDIFVFNQFYYVFYAINVIIIPMIWYIFLVISFYIISRTIDDLIGYEVIETFPSEFKNLTFYELQHIKVEKYLKYGKFSKAPWITEEEFQQVIVRLKTISQEAFYSLFMISILQRQLFEDKYFSPWRISIQYMYMYIWLIVVIKYILTIF